MKPNVIFFGKATPHGDSGRINYDFLMELKEKYGWKLVGEGFPDCMPNVSTVDIINKFDKEETVDWIFGLSNYLNMNPTIKECVTDVKKAELAHDLHASPDSYIDNANRDLDLWLLKCQYAKTIFLTYEDFNRACLSGGSMKQWTTDKHCFNVDKNYYLDRITIDCEFIPLSLDPKYYQPSEEKKRDIAMIASIGQFYPLRLQMKEELPAISKEKGWNTLIQTPPNIRKYREDIRLVLDNPKRRKVWFVGEDYRKAIAQSKIFLFDSGFADVPVAKYFEGMMSGSLVMADKPFHTDDLHFKDGWNYVEINKDNWKEKIEYYLEDDQLRETIARRGRATALKYHTNEVRAKELMEILSRSKYYE